MKRGREQFHKAKPILNILCKCMYIFPCSVRKKMLEMFRMTKGKKGLGIRYILIKTLAKTCGDNVSIHPSVYLFHIENLSLGNNVSIHPMCYIDCGEKGEVRIGNDVSIAHGVTILGSNHHYQNINIPIKDQGLSFGKTIILDNVWIGAKSTILCGKIIETGCIIAANCVITKNTLANTIVAGIPGKTIKKRGEE